MFDFALENFEPTCRVQSLAEAVSDSGLWTCSTGAKVRSAGSSWFDSLEKRVLITLGELALSKLESCRWRLEVVEAPLSVEFRLEPSSKFD